MGIVTILFDSDKRSANYKKIVATVTNNRFQPVSFAFGVKSGFDTVKTLNSGVFDITDLAIGATTTIVLGSMGVSTSGIVLSDTYEVSMEETQGGATIPYELGSFTVLPIGSASGCKGPDLQHSLNCADNIISVSDKTDYNGYDVDTRELKIIYPNIDGDTPADVLGGGEVLSAPLNYINATYGVSMDVLISQTKTEGLNRFKYVERLSDKKDVFVDCSYDLCVLHPCIKEQFNKLEAEACEIGGYSQLSSSKRVLLERLSTAITRHALAVTCNDINEATKISGEIKQLLGSDCGCGSVSKDPVAVSLNPFLSVFSVNHFGGGAQVLKGFNGTVLEERTILGRGSDIDVVTDGDIIYVENKQPIAAAVIEHDKFSQVTTGDGELALIVPAHWNGRKFSGAIFRCMTGSGSVNVEFKSTPPNSLVAASIGEAVVGASALVPSSVTFGTPHTLVAGEVLTISKTVSGTVYGLTGTLTIEGEADTVPESFVTIVSATPTESVDGEHGVILVLNHSLLPNTGAYMEWSVDGSEFRLFGVGNSPTTFVATGIASNGQTRTLVVRESSNPSVSDTIEYQSPS